MGVGAGDHHLSGLKGLTERIERLGCEFRQLVKEQHAIVGQGDLAGLHLEAAAHQRRHGGGMVRAAERAGARQLPLGDQTGDGVDHRGLEQLLRRQRRQEAGQTLGHHRLARARRPGEKQVVAARRGDLQRPFRLLLALHLTQVRLGPAVPHRAGFGGAHHLRAAEMVDHGDEGPRGQD
jgi:hypothetical protein